MVAVGVVAFSGLVDADLAAVVGDLFGGAVVGGAVLGDHRTVAAAFIELFDVGFVAVAVLEGFAFAAVLRVLIDEREVASALLLLQRAVR